MWPGRPTKHFFVDEAGDLTLFDQKGRSLLGREGVSDLFMIGMIDLPDPLPPHLPDVGVLRGCQRQRS
jgi:hypothetical protein